MPAILVALATLVAVATSPAPTSTPSSTYTNARFGFAVDYPAHWTVDRLSDNGDGVRLATGDGASVLAFAGYRVLGLEEDQARGEPLRTAAGCEGRVVREADELRLVVRGPRADYTVLVQATDLDREAYREVLGSLRTPDC